MALQMVSVGPTTLNARWEGDIQTAIDKLPGGGRVYIEGEWLNPPAGIEVTTDNVELLGDGIDKTIIKVEYTPSRGSKIIGPRPYGVIAVESLTGGVPVKNFQISDLTIEAPTTGMDPACKMLMLGITQGARVRRVKCVGSEYEFIYHGEWLYNAGDPHVSADLLIEDCEFVGQGLHSSPINSNNPFLDGYQLIGNYIHDGDGGAILMTGKNGVILRNRIKRIRGRAIAANENHEQNLLIAYNILDDISVYDFASDTFGIGVSSQSQFQNGGVQIAHNIITNLREWVDPEGLLPPRPATGIITNGSVKVGFNTIRGVWGGNGQSSSTAIALRSGGEGCNRPELMYNTIEAAPVGGQFRWGLLVNREEGLVVVVMGNIVHRGATLPYPDGMAFYDYYGRAIHQGNIYNGWFFTGYDQGHNHDGSLDDVFWK